MKKSALALGLVLPALGVASTGGSLVPTERVSVSSSGAQGNLDSIHPSISADGRFVAFESMAATLVPGDVNACLLPSGGWPCPDIFVRDRRTGITTRVSVSSAGDEANEESHTPDISGDGRFVVFSSEASNLAPDDNIYEDIFVRDRDSDENGVFDEPGGATTTLVSMSARGGDADWKSYRACHQRRRPLHRLCVRGVQPSPERRPERPERYEPVVGRLRPGPCERGDRPRQRLVRRRPGQRL